MVDCDVGDEVGSGEDEGVVLEVVDEVGSVDWRIYNKGVNSGVSVWAGGIVGWGVDTGVVSADRILFGIDYGSDMGSSS